MQCGNNGCGTTPLHPGTTQDLKSTTAHSLWFLIGHALVWQNTCIIILQCFKCQNQEPLIWAQKPLSVCQDQSEYLLLINHNGIPVIYCGNANQNVLLQQNKCPNLRSSEESPSHFWEEFANHSQYLTQMEENKLICAILSVCVLNLTQLAENGQMFPAWPRERNIAEELVQHFLPLLRILKVHDWQAEIVWSIGWKLPQDGVISFQELDLYAQV